MNITGNFTMFVKELVYHSNKPSSKVFTTTISRKLEDGSYINKSIDMVFSSKIITDAVRATLIESNIYSVDVDKGFLSIDAYKDDKEQLIKKVIIVVQEAKITLKSNKA